ncbi:MAG: nucleoside-diphosphate kinase [Kiritimatiellae bacterium]|nr:nucleoside-diphosphate kinase [Kiritimatiellia bacterium]MDD5520429.1 nucleoside-diphosphate kinase [Kiritimatiellia bacterium]
MAEELAYVLINPYTISKSRTGGVIARFIGRTDLNLVAARMFGPSRELVEQYAEVVRSTDHGTSDASDLIADYIIKSYAPNPVTGKPRRVMMLLFEGEDAISKIWHITGSATLKWGSGETIRDTYGDFITDENGKVQYFEPAVLVAPTKKRAAASLNLWAKYSESDGGIIESATDVPAGEQVEKTLVMLKPDNFRFPSSRPGNIIDLLSSSGLRIVAIKKFSMTVAQAEEFYGPVRDALKKKFKNIGADRAKSALEKEFGFKMPADALDALCVDLASAFATSQFESIVKFITGFKPSECAEDEKASKGTESCLALVYEGLNAVEKIRSILGPTDPNKAKPGSVRREFGSNIMVNAAHASDSVENADREIRIIKVKDDTIRQWVNKHYTAS